MRGVVAHQRRHDSVNSLFVCMSYINGVFSFMIAHTNKLQLCNCVVHTSRLHLVKNPLSMKNPSTRQSPISPNMAIKVVLFVGEWQSADLDAAKALAVKELDCLAAEVLDSIRDALEEQLVIKMVSFPANEWIEVASNDVVSSAEVEEAAQTREAIKLHSITSLPCLLITDIGHTVVYRHSITVHLNEIASTDGTKPVDTESVFTAGIRQYEDLHLAQAAAR